MTTLLTSLSIYQLRIVLRGISPLIWRRVLVRSDMTLAYLHTLLQVVFAWSDEHLHSFYIHGREYGSDGAPTGDVRLHDLRLHRGERFRYVYDFGALCRRWCFKRGHRWKQHFIDQSYRSRHLHF